MTPPITLHQWEGERKPLSAIRYVLIVLIIIRLIFVSFVVIPDHRYYTRCFFNFIFLRL